MQRRVRGSQLQQAVGVLILLHCPRSGCLVSTPTWRRRRCLSCLRHFRVNLGPNVTFRERIALWLLPLSNSSRQIRWLGRSDATSRRGRRRHKIDKTKANAFPHAPAENAAASALSQHYIMPRSTTYVCDSRRKFRISLVVFLSDGGGPAVATFNIAMWISYKD